ncbi:MAG TPA: circularly permuted type 2 ATP-grasp protein [Propionibacteriaceae bacterium]
MTILSRYLAAASRPSPMESQQVFDEFAAADGTVRQGWSTVLAGLDEFADTDLLKAQHEVARLLEDDNVTYTPSPASTISIADEPNGHGPPTTPTTTGLVEPRPWRLDPLPLILEDREWAGLEAGLVQRAQLLDAIMADLYGARRLLSRYQVPAAAIFDHDEYVRPLVGSNAVARQRLFMVAADLGRDGSGQWKVISDRTQAPSGAGYAMQNRRVVARVMPEIYHQANLHRLTPFFQAMRLALVDAAPSAIEDPRVVVLSPGTLSETAFDQAFVASLLGFPLLEGSDLTVRDGRVWMRVLGKLEQVDVILRRIDSTWMDALELRPDSRLGVTGLLECVRQGTVTVLNNLGSGVLENPALMPLLPELCERLLGQSLRLPSVETWWCGDHAALSHVLSNLDSLVIRPISRGHGRSVRGAGLTRRQRELLADKIKALPHRFVGQEVLNLSSAPTSEEDRLVRRNVVLRSFAVRSGESYAAMLGGLARVGDDASERRGVFVTDPNNQLAKDVWVVGTEPVAAPRILARDRAEEEPGFVPAVSASIAMVPRVLSDLYWFGRYAERAEDLLRVLLATRTVAVEADFDLSPGRALEVMLQAVTHVSTTYPGFVGSLREMIPEFRSMLLDRQRIGTVAQSLGALSLAAQGVRDQLSEDVWMVLADIERALAALAANPYDQGLQLTDVSERVLSGLLALAGIATENMVRDPGWYMLDSGRGLERALQILALLRVTICEERVAETDDIVLEAVLTAAESIVTFRRRYSTRARVDALLELLLIDPFNPRSVAYQLNRIRNDLRALPNTSPTARPLRLLDSLAERVRTSDPVALAESENSRRTELHDLLAGLQDQLRALSDAIRDHYQQQPPTQRPLFRPDAVGGRA